MLKRLRNLGSDILVQTAAAGHIHGLHTPADAEQRDISLSRLVDDIQLKARATFTYGSKRITLAFSVQ